MSYSFDTQEFKYKEESDDFFRRTLKRIFLDDWLIKLIALAITFALWLGVTGLRAPTTTPIRDVTLNPLVSNDLEITNMPIQEVDLVVTGYKTRLDQLNRNGLIATLDLTNVSEGKKDIPLTPENVRANLPEGVKIDRIEPRELSITLEKVVEKVVTVRPQTEGNTAEGFEVYQMKAEPETVKIKGPASFINDIDFIPTEPIDLNNEDKNFDVQQVALNILIPKVTPVSAVSTNVFVRIGKKRIERLFVVPYDTESRSGKASVLLYGPNSVLENITVSDLIVVEEKTEKNKTRLRLVIPEKIRDSVEVKAVKYRE